MRLRDASNTSLEQPCHRLAGIRSTTDGESGRWISSQRLSRTVPKTVPTLGRNCCELVPDRRRAKCDFLARICCLKRSSTTQTHIRPTQLSRNRRVAGSSPARGATPVTSMKSVTYSIRLGCVSLSTCPVGCCGGRGRAGRCSQLPRQATC
jgi:hypothetical protein